MQRIADDPTQATCPSFEDPIWEFLRRTLVDAHQGDQPLTMEEAAQQMKDAWACENQLKVDAWCNGLAPFVRLGPLNTLKSTK